MIRRSKALVAALIGLPLIVVVSVAAAVAQTAPPGVESVQIPAGVRYKYADASTNRDALAHILSAFNSGKDPSVLGNRVIIGPNLWQRMRQIPEIAKIPKGVTNFKVPTRDQQGKVVGEDSREGKLIQSKADSNTLYSALTALTRGKELKLRKLRPGELSYYWSIISWDIEEPLFALEGPGLTLLVQYVSKSKDVFFIDELGVGGQAQAAARPAAVEPSVKDAKKRELQELQRRAVLVREQEAKRQKQGRESACTYKPVMSNDDLKNCGVSSR